MHALQAKILDPRLGSEFPLPQYATPVPPASTCAPCSRKT